MRRMIVGSMILFLLVLGCAEKKSSKTAKFNEVANKSDDSKESDADNSEALFNAVANNLGEWNNAADLDSRTFQAPVRAGSGGGVGGGGYGGRPMSANLGGIHFYGRGFVENGRSYTGNSGRALRSFTVISGSPGSGVDGPLKRKKKRRVKTWKRSELVPNASRIMVGDHDELELKGMQASVQIDGFRARVVLDCFFLNDHERPLEGSFQLRLPNEASLYFFAFGETAYELKEQKLPQNAFLGRTQNTAQVFEPKKILELRKDKWTKPKVARMVPRQKAAFAYRETVRRRVDPALVEWSGAGIFSARVFPLAPQKLHRIVIGYDVPLIAAGNDLEYRLDLPSSVYCKTDISIANIPGAKVTVSPNSKEEKATGRSNFQFDNPDERTIKVRIDNPGTIMLTGEDKETGPYFSTRFSPQIPKIATNSGPTRGIIMFDVSLSSNPERVNIWLKMMEEILNSNRETMPEFAVMFFNIETFWWKNGFVKNDEANTKALLAFANTLSLEGATNLNRALGEAVNPSWNKDNQPADLFLLSDGAANWGENDLYALSNTLDSGNHPALFAYSTGMSGTDMRIISHLTRESGGAVFSVVGDEQVKKAAIAHRSRPWQIESLKIDGGTDLLLSGRPTTIFPGQTLTLTGRGNIPTEKQPTIVLSLRNGEDQKQVEIKIDQIVTSELATRSYGQVAVEQLESMVDATEDVSIAFARHFRVTGRTCSLLMLDSEEDYKRFNIKPEEDTFVIKKKLASKTVADAIANLGDLLKNPKQRFLSWVNKLDKMPGVKFELSAALKTALEQIPADSYDVKSSPLNCQLRTFQGVPGELQEQLASRKLLYDAIIKEAERRRTKHGVGDALRLLSSLVENQPGNVPTARDVGFTAMEWGLGGEVFPLFRRIARARPYEPHSYHAMARCLTEMENIDLAVAYYELALAGQWNGRFGEFRNIVGLEYMHLLREIETGKLHCEIADFASARFKTLSLEFGLAKSDLVVSIMWNTDGTDVDLHVTDPTGEECYYEHRETKIGGRLTSDVTQGFGPEMFRLQKAPAGSYAVRVKYYSSDASRTSTRTKVYATIYQQWGTPEEKIFRKVITLDRGKQMHDILTVEFK